MKSIKLDIKLLGNDVKWLALLSILLPVINALIIIKGGVTSSISSLQQAVLIVLGSVSEQNWMFWLFFSFGYLIVLQIIWKPHVRMFELNVLLRHQNITLFWLGKWMIGLLFTALYVLTSWLILIVMLSLSGGHPFSLGWPAFAIVFSLALNFYLHGMIWLVIKNTLSVKMANLFLLVLIYAGVRATKIWVPLFYSMYVLISPILWLVWGSEVILILFLFSLIVYLGKRSDYY